MLSIFSLKVLIQTSIDIFVAQTARYNAEELPRYEKQAKRVELINEGSF